MRKFTGREYCPKVFESVDTMTSLVTSNAISRTDMIMNIFSLNETLGERAPY